MISKQIKVKESELNKIFYTNIWNKYVDFARFANTTNEVGAAKSWFLLSYDVWNKLSFYGDFYM